MSTVPMAGLSHASDSVVSRFFQNLGLESPEKKVERQYKENIQKVVIQHQQALYLVVNKYNKLLRAVEKECGSTADGDTVRQIKGIIDEKRKQQIDQINAEYGAQLAELSLEVHN